jgi:hypothetical protein
MDVWFQHLAGFFTRTDADTRTVRKLLDAAAKRSAAVGFAPLDTEQAPRPEHGSLEAIEADSILVMTPRDSGIQLVVGERLTICIGGESGFDVGEVVVMGEWVHRDETSCRSGVRVSLPRSLEHVQRRDRHRLPVAFDLSPRATLEAGTPPAVFGKGEVLDISESGARLHVDATRAIEVGNVVGATLSFPAPFPSVTARVEVVHVASIPESGKMIVGVHFLEPHPELGRSIHKLELKRAQRLRK